MTQLTGRKSTQHVSDVRTDLGTIEFRMCGECGVVWGMPEPFMELRRQDGGTWFCPNGHRWHYSGETLETKLRRERDAARDRAARATARADQVEASLRATKGVVTKQRKQLGRVKNGVCPCCTRSFKDLHRHMKTQHPGFDPSP